jgi:CO/xanthine dehydrogenase Mo-binding subunit
MAEKGWLGRSVPRVDAVDKVTGAAQYVADIRLPNTLHMRVLRSTQAHARLVEVDTRQAEEVPGLVAAITGRGCPYIFGSCIFDQPPMAADKVRFVGEPVAAVIGRSQDAALEAVELIQVKYEPLPAVFDPREAMAPEAPLLHEGLGQYRCAPSFHPRPGSNIFHHYKLRKGNVAKGLQQAELVVENHFQFPHISHAQLEPHGTIALWERNGQLKVWTSAQSPFFVRHSLATAFGLPHSKVRVVVPYIGGGFGGKSDVTIEPLVAYVARAAVGYPVRLVLTREEMFSGTVLGRGCWARIKTGVKKNGLVVAEEIELAFGAGAYGDYCINIVEGAGHNATGPYQIPHVKVDSYGVYTNTPAVGAYRGYGHPEVHWMVERQMEIIARKLQLDPVQLRRRNILRPGSINAFGQKIDATHGQLDECIRRVDCELKKGSGQGSGDRGAHRVRGTGIAAFMKSPVMATNAASSAMVKFAEDGTVNVLVGCTEMGQGSFTVLGQMAAEVLQVPLEKVNVCQVIDTDVNPYEWQTVASSTTWKVGNAVAQAAGKALEQVKEIAAQAWGVSPGEVEHGAERIFLRKDPETSLSLSALALGCVHPDGRAIGGPVVGYGRFVPQGLTYPDPDTGQGNLAAEWTFGCQGAEVEVDLRTGQIQVLRLITAVDAGKIVNPVLARGQVVGAMVYGLGAAMSERIIYSPEGWIRNDSLTDYKVPTPGDVSSTEFVVIFLDTPFPESFCGARPLAEHGSVAVAPAIANAVNDAAGIQFFILPMTAERVVEKLHDKEDQVC